MFGVYGQTVFKSEGLIDPPKCGELKCYFEFCNKSLSDVLWHTFYTWLLPYVQHTHRGWHTSTLSTIFLGFWNLIYLPLKYTLAAQLDICNMQRPDSSYATTILPVTLTGTCSLQNVSWRGLFLHNLKMYYFFVARANHRGIFHTWE